VHIEVGFCAGKGTDGFHERVRGDGLGWGRREEVREEGVEEVEDEGGVEEDGRYEVR